MRRRLYKRRKNLSRGKPRRRRSRKASTNIVLNKDKLRKWSLAIREIDDYRCVACNCKSKVLHAHHVISKNYRPQFAYDLDNGITLCKACHMGKGGVHSSEMPRNEVVATLRIVFWKKSIQIARLHTTRLRKR